MSDERDTHEEWIEDNADKAVKQERSLKNIMAEMIENACSVSYLTAEPLADDLIDLMLRTIEAVKPNA